MKRLLLIVVILVPLLRVAATFPIFSQTTDESIHIGTGMEWLTTPEYKIDPEHPPMARIAAAILPFLSGAREVDGNTLLDRDGRYMHNLAVARAGNLVFLLITLVVVFVWSKQLFGTTTALIAIALYGALPTVLAHSGVATTDSAAAASMTLALYLFARLLENQTWRNSIAFGFGLGFALLCKFSFILFFPAAALMFLVAPLPEAGRGWREAPGEGLLRVATAIPIAFLLVWAGYKFSFDVIGDKALSSESKEHVAAAYSSVPGYEWVQPDHIQRYRDFGDYAQNRGVTNVDFVDWAKAAGYSSPLAFRSGRDSTNGLAPIPRSVRDVLLAPFRSLAERIVMHTRVPAPYFWAGIRMVATHSEIGHPSFLLGRYSDHGWWYYFPVVFFFKTPIAFTILAIAGIVLLLVQNRQSCLSPIALAPIAMFVSAMFGGINIGVRHILPTHPLLAMCAAHAAISMWNSRARWGVALLALWFAASSIRAHPDYIAYFNEAAGDHPEHVALDSNLDWQQDIVRLSEFVKRERINHIWLAVWGTQGRARWHMPADPLPRDRRVTGWIAVSEMQFRFGGPDNRGGYAWLLNERPVRRIGKSIRVYYIAR